MISPSLPVLSYCPLWEVVRPSPPAVLVTPDGALSKAASPSLTAGPSSPLISAEASLVLQRTASGHTQHVTRRMQDATVNRQDDSQLNGSCLWPA